MNSHHGHVVCANLDILPRPSLIEHFSRGNKFWRAFFSHLSVEEVIEKCLKKFVNKLEELLRVQEIFSEWKANDLVLVLSMLCSSSRSSLSVTSSKLDCLKSFQCSFVITYMDKCCTNFIFVRKLCYVSLFFFELNSPIGMYQVSNLRESFNFIILVIRLIILVVKYVVHISLSLSKLEVP